MKPKPRRDGGLAVHFSAIIIFGAAAPVLAAAAADLSDLRFWIAAAACALISGGLFCYALVRDTWNAAMLVLIACMSLSVFVWPYILIVSGFDPTRWMSRFGVALATAGTAAALYVLWRRYGPERAEDFLGDGDSAQEIDGIALRWVHDQSAHAGTCVFIAVELQNAWNAPATCRVRLTIPRRDRAYLRVAGDTPARLVAGEYGVLHIPLEVMPHARGRYRVKLDFIGRPATRFRGRLRLRPKPTLPVGPMAVMTVMAALAKKTVDYQSAAIDLDVTPGTDPSPALPAEPHWERRWVPEGLRDHPA